MIAQILIKEKSEQDWNECRQYPCNTDELEVTPSGNRDDIDKIESVI